MYFIGIDAGSVTAKLVVLDSEGRKREGHYVRHYGHPLRVCLELLRETAGRYPQSSISVTGSAGRPIASALGIKPVNEIVAQSCAVRKLYPHVRTVIELGGEDSKLIVLDQGRVREFAMNSVCAAGTGSFLEQQAERLRMSIEEFSDVAVRSKRPSKVAGRCSVFAKSDMIHLQQIATPVEDIVSGLCFAVARNFKGTIAKGIDLKPPVAFQGGVAANHGMVRAFREVFGLDDLFVPVDFALMGAIGSALKDLDEGLTCPFDIEALEAYVSSLTFADKGYAPLVEAHDSFFARHRQGEGARATQRGDGSVESSPRTAYLGIDIGSISTNLAVIDEEGNILAKRYLMTAGRPIEAVQQGLRGIYEDLGGSVVICGVGTTGSGRYMIADYVGADIVKNEITAQATAAVWINPEVDTIFEIGGQDSKYISLRDGVIVDFEMNKACAAGTGSFLEEQAEKLSISVKGEFAESAFRARNPCRLGERCTVFMENSLMASLQRGAQKDDLLGGLAYSIVQNYINRVVAGKPIGNTIFFQGGVAFNKSVVAAFEKYLGREITVPPHHDVTGAIGMALIAKGHMNDGSVSSLQSKVMMDRDGQSPTGNREPAVVGHGQGSTAGRQAAAVTVQSLADEGGYCANGSIVASGPQTFFKGFELAERPFEISSFGCKGCPNVCEINRVKVEGESDYLFYGGRCEKYDVRRTLKGSLPDLFAYREEALWHEHHRYGERRSEPLRDTKRGLKIGIPYMFFFHDCLPFWSTLLWELGFEVVVSPKTNKQIVTLGVENVLSEACFPVKVAHGHVKYLVDAGMNAVFLPSFININRGEDEYGRGEACPYTQTIPYMSRAAIRDIDIVTPIVDFARGEEFLRKEIYRSLKRFGVRKGEVARAFDTAHISQERFRRRIKEKGREVMDSLGAGGGAPAVVIIGRGYNAFDSGVNLEIPRKLSTIDVLSIPMDFLPLGQENLERSWPNMYWRSGQRILKAARIVRSTPGVFAIYIGNFSCGPDSFILKYFREEMEGKPFLHIEIDEHSADAGAITRCEAFLDSVRQQAHQGTWSSGRGGSERAVTGSNALPSAALASRGLNRQELRERTIYIPRMSDHTLAIKAAFEHCGITAEVLPESDSESVEIGKRHVSGKECYPYLITVGDMLKKAFSSDFRPERSTFLMPSGTGPCRFGQYNVSQRLILKKLGLSDVPIFSPNQDAGFYRDLGIAGNEFTMRAWRGIIAYELLIKCTHETRPYEICGGETDGLSKDYELKIYEALRSSNGALDHLLGRMRRDFTAIPRRPEKRPLIGVIGEIFVRSHRFSNENLVRKLEALGGEVWLAPVEEWLYYMNEMSMRKALIKKDRSAMMSIFLKRFFQRRVEHSYGRTFRESLKTLHEPGTREILRKAAPYVHDSFEGETILSIGKAVDLMERGASGIVNAMPFGCMPGTIVTALLKALSKDYGVPSISIPYDGTASSTTELQLEAFMESILNR